MKNCFNKIRYALVLIGVIIPALINAQGTPMAAAHYYVDLNFSDGSVVNEISDEWLSIEYNDQHGRAAAIELKLYDWQEHLVAQFSLNKQFGLNYFNIDLKANCPGWAVDKLYRCEATNEGNEKFVLLIKSAKPVDRPAPVVNILVNPLHVECSGLSNSTIEFYGNVTGARTPYEATWYVINSQKTGLLYQPRTEIVERAGNTASIFTDAKLDYYVKLIIKDACGMEQTQTIHLSCQTKPGNVSTLFFEPIQQIPTPPNGN